MEEPLKPPIDVDIPDDPQGKLILRVFSPEASGNVVELPLTSEQARRLAASLINAADRLEEGHVRE